MKAVRGEAKINGKQMFLHELVAEHMRVGVYTEIENKESRQINQLQWDAHYKTTRRWRKMALSRSLHGIE